MTLEQSRFGEDMKRWSWFAKVEERILEMKMRVDLVWKEYGIRPMFENWIRKFHGAPLAID